VVRNYVFNRGQALNGDRMAAEIGELIDDRLHTRSVSARPGPFPASPRGIDRIDLLKINVEKRVDVLMGIGAGDWPKIRQLVIEVDLSENLEPITELLERQGYEYLVEQDPLLRKTELCYVYAIRPSAGGPRLIRQPADATVRSQPPADDEVLTPAILRRFLKQRLPPYMVPSAFVPMERFPLTANGKIDRHALPEFSFADSQPIQEFVKPRSETEIALAAIWAELLKVGSLDIHDNFFELGGHSLLAIQAASLFRISSASTFRPRRCLKIRRLRACPLS
jgi:hypothetical protein